MRAASLDYLTAGMRNRSLLRPSYACARPREPSSDAGDAACACARVVTRVFFQAPPSPSPPPLIVALLSEPARSGFFPPLPSARLGLPTILCCDRKVRCFIVLRSPARSGLRRNIEGALMAESQSAAGLGDFTSLSGAAALGSEPETRRLSELRVIDLRAELKRRNLDSGGNKSVLMERLRKVRRQPGGRGGHGRGRWHPGSLSLARGCLAHARSGPGPESRAAGPEGSASCAAATPRPAPPLLPGAGPEQPRGVL